MIDETITIRPFDPAENAEMLTAAHAMHFTSRDSAVKRSSYVHWLLSNPEANNIFLASYVNGTFASFLGFMPRKVVGFGCEYRGALAFGAMTLPEFGGRGLYRRLAQAGWDEARRRGFDFAMGYTTQQYVLDLEMGMGWSNMGASPVMALPLDGPAIVRAALPALSMIAPLAAPFSWAAPRIARWAAGRTEPGSYAITSAQGFDADYDELTRVLKATPVLTFSKDCATLNWLYLSEHNPFSYDIIEARRNGVLAGFAVGRRMDLLGMAGYGIMDLVARPGDEAALKPMAARLVETALQGKAAAVGALVSSNSAAEHALRSIGFMNSRRSFTLIFRPTRDPVANHLLVAENWSNFWGNNDTV